MDGKVKFAGLDWDVEHFDDQNKVYTLTREGVKIYADYNEVKLYEIAENIKKDFGFTEKDSSDGPFFDVPSDLS